MFQRWIYPNYRRISRASRRSGRRLSERGQLVQTGMIITAALGVDTELTLIYQLFCFLVVIYLVSRIATRWRRPQLTLRRSLPRYVTAGEPFAYRITISNHGTRTERDLRVFDNPLVQTPAYNEFAVAHEPGEEKRNAYDRLVRFHRFVWLQRWKTGLTIDSSPIPGIPVSGSVDVKMEATPLRRGRMELASMTVAQPDPLGVLYGLQEFREPARLISLPKRYPLPRGYTPPGGRHYQPGGISSAWSVGESEEFTSLREYREGDSPRKIHWPSTAKRDKPVVRENQDEFFVRQALVLDTVIGESAGDDPDLLEDAVAVAASFAVTVGTGDSLLDLIFVADEALLCTAGRGTGHAEQMLEILSTVRRSDLPFSRLSKTVLHHAHVLSGVMLILLSYDEPRQRLVQRLGARNLPLEVLVVTNDDSLVLPASDERLRFRALHHGCIGEELGQL